MGQFIVYALLTWFMSAFPPADSVHADSFDEVQIESISSHEYRKPNRTFKNENDNQKSKDGDVH